MPQSLQRPELSDLLLDTRSDKLMGLILYDETL